MSPSHYPEFVKEISMRYMLVNVGPGSLQIDLYSPDPSYNKKNLHRPGPKIALNIPRGKSIDILPSFDGSIEKAHESIKYSRDTLKLIRPNLLHTYVCNDEGEPIDITKILNMKASEVDIVEDEEENQLNENQEKDHTDENQEEDHPDENQEKSQSEDITRPDMNQGAILAAIDKHEAEITGELIPRVDNLTKIKGIGEAMEQKLYNAGFMTYASIAEANLDDLTKIVGYKSQEIQDQAKELAK